MTGHGRVANKNNRSLQRKRSKAFFHKWNLKTQAASETKGPTSPRGLKDPAKAARLLDNYKTAMALHHLITAVVLIFGIGLTLYYIFY